MLSDDDAEATGTTTRHEFVQGGIAARGNNVDVGDAWPGCAW